MFRTWHLMSDCLGSNLISDSFLFLAVLVFFICKMELFRALSNTCID